MSSLDNNPFHCPKHGFTEVITAEGVGSVPKARCPFCRAEEAEAINDFTKKALADAGFQHLPEALKELKTQADRVKELEAEVVRRQPQAITEMHRKQRVELEAEVERLNKLVTMGNGVMVEKAYLNGLKARLELVRPLVDQIVTAPKGSIGGLFTHYLPQLRVDDVDNIRAAILAAPTPGEGENTDD